MPITDAAWDDGSRADSATAVTTPVGESDDGTEAEASADTTTRDRLDTAEARA